MAPVLLTGASGFIGRQILRALTERGITVRAVIRDATRGRLEDTDAIESIIETPDLFSEDSGWLTEICAGIDTIIHAAWYAEPGHYLQSPKNSLCLDGTLRLAQAASAAKARRFIGIGSCVEYDTSGGTLSVATPLLPATPYAKAKAQAFHALSQYFAQRQIAFAWCRLFYLYGEGEDPRRLVPYLHARLGAGEPAELGSGDKVRDYLDVREAGRMIADAALGTAQGPLNICSGKPVTIREIAERIADGYGRRDLLRFGARPEAPDDPPVIVGVRN